MEIYTRFVVLCSAIGFFFSLNSCQPPRRPIPYISHAIYQGWTYNEVKTLLKNGASPNERDAVTQRPVLHQAIAQQDHNIIQLLLTHGANPHLADRDRGITPLCHAIREGDQDTVAILLHYHASPNVCMRGQGEMPPLSYAVRCCRQDIVEMLLAYGAYPNLHQQKQYIPLHEAFSYRQFSLLKRLLAYGAHPDIRNQNQQTVLHRAIMDYNVDVCLLLIQYNANIQQEDNTGIKPFDLAQRHEGDVYRVMNWIQKGYPCVLSLRQSRRELMRRAHIAYSRGYIQKGHLLAQWIDPVDQAHILQEALFCYIHGVYIPQDLYAYTAFCIQNAEGISGLIACIDTLYHIKRETARCHWYVFLAQAAYVVMKHSHTPRKAFVRCLYSRCALQETSPLHIAIALDAAHGYYDMSKDHAMIRHMFTHDTVNGWHPFQVAYMLQSCRYGSLVFEHIYYLYHQYIQSLTRDEETAFTTCAICYTTYQETPETSFHILPCQHVFHRDCIKAWMKHKRRCPLCKAPTHTRVSLS